MYAPRLFPRWPALLAAALLASPGLSTCAAASAPRPVPSPSPSANIPTGSPAVVFAPSARPEVQVGVEIAATADARRQGLMNRTSLAADRGMLFIFPTESNHTFWMKDTPIPLDMIFVNKSLRVVGVVANAEPMTETIRDVGVPSTYVVEVNGGYAANHGITTGTTMRLVDVNVTPR